MKSKELTAKDFASKFPLPSNGFSDPVEFTDAVGFSTLKPRQQDGKNFASLYKFYIADRDLNESVKLKPINISVSYGQVIDKGISLSHEGIKRRNNWPIDLSSRDEFYYNPENSEFTYKNKQIKPEDLLKAVEKLHLKPTFFIKGFWFKTKLFILRQALPTLIDIINTLFIKILYFISGTITTKGTLLVEDPRNSVQRKDATSREEFANEKINILGYKASAWSVVVYSLLHLVLYTFWFLNFRNQNIVFVTKLLSNAFLTLSYVIPSLVFFERIIPSFLQRIIRYIGRLYRKVLFSSIKI